MGLEEMPKCSEGWLDTVHRTKDAAETSFSLLKASENCYYLPQGKSRDRVTEKDARILIGNLAKLSKPDYAVVDAGIRGTPSAMEFAQQSSMTVTVIECESNCLFRLNQTKLLQGEYLLINRFMMKSEVMKDIELILRKSSFGDSVLRYTVQYDECMIRSFMQMMPVTRFLPISSAARSIEKLMIDVLTICEITSQRQES